MKSTKSILLCGVFLSAIAVAGDVNADFKKFIKSEIENVARAYGKRDISYFKSMSTTDFTETMRGQTYAKDEAMHRLSNWFGMIKSASAKLDLISSKASGNTGIVAIHTHMIVIAQMDLKVKRSDTITVDMWETETWVRSGKGWKIKKLVEAKPTKMLKNGKPLDPLKASD